MGKGRLGAFSDGVIAIIITIMVLELRPPHEETPEALGPLLPALFSYVLSFVYVGIYWNNHHHMLLAVRRVSGMTLWANLHLLFWLSLIPFVTRWMGESRFAAWPVAAYGFVLLMCALSWSILSRLLVKHHGEDSDLASALGRERKESGSIALYVIGIAITFIGRALEGGEGGRTGASRPARYLPWWPRYGSSPTGGSSGCWRSETTRTQTSDRSTLNGSLHGNGQ